MLNCAFREFYCILVTLKRSPHLKYKWTEHAEKGSVHITSDFFLKSFPKKNKSQKLSLAR